MIKRVLFVKARIVRGLCEQVRIDPENVAYIGDGENDVEAFSIVGHPIAFNTNNQVVLDAAQYIIGSANLADCIPVIKKLR